MNEKPLKDWTFNELVDYHKGNVLVAIGRGEFAYAMWLFAEHVCQWKEAREKSK